MAQPANQPIGIRSSGLSATIDPHGAQLLSLKTAAAHELLWQGDPAYWTDRAPILFPVIGPVVNGQIRHNGKTFPMPPHGFARQRDFTVAEHATSRCIFELRADAETRVHYPFDFTLRVAFELSNDTLEVTISVTNDDTEPLPADVGFHPGFQWPLMPDHPREEYAIVFAERESAPIRRGVDDPIFLLPDRRPTPVEGNVLRPRDELFDDNAIVFDRITSRSLIYGTRTSRGDLCMHLEFPDSPYLAIWTKPGAPFVAIEPWQGLPSPVAFNGPLIEKPGIAVIDPGETRGWHLKITVQPSDA